MSEDALNPAHAAAATRPRSSKLEEEVVGLFDQLRDRLLRYLLSMRLPSHDAEEVIQEAFLALFRHLQRDKPRHNLRAWMFQVTHNLALKRRETDKRKRDGLSELGLRFEESSRSRPGPEDQFLNHQRRARLFGVWQALPEQDRHALALRAEGLSYREIAEVLNISLGSVAASLARSLARFAGAEQR